MDKFVDFWRGILWWWWRGIPLVSFVISHAIAASFYGDGYVLLRTVESSERTSLHVRFRTSYSSGTLFLAAGDTDFCLVELQSGRIQVTLDLGSGVRSLRSEKGVQLDDLVWHTMELQQDRHNVLLTVDKYSQTSLRMPGPDLELSVQEGLFVGGLGDLEKPYLLADGTMSSFLGFRGCLDEVLFNEHNLLSSLRPYSGYKRVHEVSLGCSSEFSASADEPINFFSSRAFLALPTWDVPQEGIFECELHCSNQDGIILYSSASQGYYVAMELTGGHVVATVGSATAKTELRCPLSEGESEWHLVRMHLSTVTVHLVVGGDIQNASLDLPTNALLLSGPLFIGGVDASTHVEARENELTSLVGKQTGGGSIRGCVRNIRINAQKMGLPSALVTKDISDGCKMNTPPLQSFTTPNPDISGSNVQVNSPRVDCKRGQSFLALENLRVSEGGRAPLGPQHIKMTLDLQSFGLGRQQIMIRIEEQPVHGQLRLDVNPEQEDNTFSLMDLWYSRIMYVHGGSEDPADFFMFSVFGSSKRQLPACMRGNKLHRFNISVTPSNDAPEISLPEGNLLMVLEESKRQLTTDTLRVTDPDNNSTHLMVSLLGTLNTDAGFLEIDSDPGQAVRNFSYLHLEQGRIYYVHTGVKNSRIALRVTDGEKVSNTVVLRVMAVQLEYRVVNNTGVEVTQGGWAVLSSKHLAVQLNVAQQVGEVRYDVVEPPQYGELQRLFSNGEWKHTWIFTQKLLEKERIRYLSTHPGSHPGNVTDSFRFRVSISSMTTEEMLFSIVVQGIHYKVMKSKMQVDAERRVTLTSQDLRAVSKGMKIPDSELYFLLLSLPKKGHLMLDNKVLRINGTFSQKNISDEKLVYEMLDEPLADMRDSFTFLVFSKYSYSANHDFRFIIKASTQNIVLTNLGLSLKEGDSKVITRDDLFSDTNANSEVLYKVTSSPKYGKLSIINLSDSAVNNENISHFSNQDILNGRLMYVHDGSETTYDEFSFIASMNSRDDDDNDDEDNVVKGIFKISIQLDNDEKPVRVVDKVFHVAKNGQRLITLEDLCYDDADSDFDSGQLIYTRRGISLGEIVWANDTTQKLYQFRQKDMEEKRILFVHNGPSYGRFVLFVSDGRHYVSTLLEVIAQTPYIKMDKNTGLVVCKGSEVALTSANFSVSSNLDIRDDQEMTFDLFLAPKHGSLTCQGAATGSVKTFTLRDLKAGNVVYQHNDGTNLQDLFNFTVRAKGLQLDASVIVKVFLESHQRPPTIIRNNPILVDAKKPVKITRKDLEVTHKDNTPTEIVFRVKRPPSNGFLRRSVGEDEPYQGTQERPIRSFTQEDINDELIQYVHVGSDQTADSFLVDVSNSLTVVSDVMVTMEVIPEHIPLQVSTVTLSEGASRALTKDIIQVTSPQFKGLNFLYQVTEYPSNGQIENWRFPGVAIPTFTRVQAEHGFIQYVHDGSESLVDRFTLVANDTVLRRHSLPCVVHVNVTPINDEVPAVTVNRILKVWVGSITEITVEELNAEDKDSKPEHLDFIVTPPTNGHLALKSAPSRPILNFTQAHILANQLVFVHSGALSGGFHFQVNDGLNFAERETFATMARTLVLSLERNLVLKVFPGTLKAITDDHLLVVTNDFSDITGNRDITFSVKNPPKLGRLVRVMEDNSTKEISSFTQNMVNDEEIMYEQTDTDAVGWTTKDSFTFSVQSSPAILQPHTFSIEISYDNAGPEQRTILLANTGAVVPEGGKVVIDKSKLDASNMLKKVQEPKKNSFEVWYRVTSLPNYGVILVRDQNLTTDQSDFSQAIVDQDGVTYVHDDSENLYDYFSFDVWLNPNGTVAQRPQDLSEVVSESFSITVTPVNDQPPVIKTVAPILKVVHGDLVTLTSENLHVEDQDTPPEDIQYTVTSRPETGFLFLSNNRNESAPAFTQGDVNSGRVHFIQDGELFPGVFNFSVTDGVHQPLNKHLRVEVEQASISMVNNTGLTLRQGQSSVVLTSKHLAAVTNKKNASITYYITQQPFHGSILKDGEKVLQFVEEDLQSAVLSYHMAELTAPEDSFECTVSLPEVNLTAQRVNITVSPLISINHHVRIPSGVAVKLRRIVLDASELAALSRSDPLFEIISPPKYGRLLKFGQSGLSKLVESFTFQDVIQGRVAIEENANMTALEGNVTLSNVTTIHHLKDSFEFLLRAKNVQPARGEFVFNVVPYNPLTRMPAITADPSHTTDPASSLNNTIQSVSPQYPHPDMEHKDPSRSHKHKHRSKGRSRSGGHTTHGQNKPPVSTAPRSTSGQQLVNFTNVPVWVESMPRPASDPLLIILPFLACLLLIVILIILILVFRHRREKRAAQQSAVGGMPAAAAAAGTASQGNDQSERRSPCLGTPERSVAMPSVIVTPVRCRANPELIGAVRGEALVGAGMGPLDPPYILCAWTPVEPEVVLEDQAGAPTLGRSQYWV